MSAGWRRRVPAAKALSRWCCVSCCRMCFRPWPYRCRSTLVGPFSTPPGSPLSASASSLRPRSASPPPPPRAPPFFRPRRQASDPGVGHHGRGGRTLHFDRQVVAGRISGTRVDAGRAVLQLARRWDAGHSRSPHADMTQPLLRIEDLHVTFSTRRGLVEAVRGVTLSLDEGEMLGLVGESGSGKSVTRLSTTRLPCAARGGTGGGGRLLRRAA